MGAAELDLAAEDFDPAVGGGPFLFGESGGEVERGMDLRVFIDRANQGPAFGCDPEAGAVRQSCDRGTSGTAELIEVAGPIAGFLFWQHNEAHQGVVQLVGIAHERPGFVGDLSDGRLVELG